MFKKLVAACAATVSAEINTDFEAYLNGGKPVTGEVFDQIWAQYDNEFTSSKLNAQNDAIRRNIFANNLEAIISHNSDPTVTYLKGINEYSDMTEEEFTAYFNIKSFAADQACSATKNRMSVSKHNVHLPPSWDWRDHNGVSPVKNQG